ncbi:MAG: asparaginase domain-containing protein [Pseudomonadaceae bacterium]|nr:asparaginase domain-containing protein [Pseudomonadaceae bacterium]
MTPESILIVTTGGTIDKVYFDAKSEFEVGQSVVADLLSQAHVTAQFDVCEVMRKDSLELDDADRDQIKAAIEAREHRCVVVTHGTDTMVETAQVLSQLTDRTIVLTGALQPARFAQTDALFNVGMAFAAAQSLQAGVYIAMNGQLFDAANVRKDRAANRFVALDGDQG